MKLYTEHSTPRIPTPELLAVIGWAAGRGAKRCTASPEFQEAFAAAVRDAVLDALIANASGDERPFPDYTNSTVVLDWLQSHKETT